MKTGQPDINNISVNLLAFYPQNHSVIGYGTHYLF